jgi:serine/threonine protein kinase
MMLMQLVYPSPALFNLLLQAAVELADMHSIGILHGDLKPENILVRILEGRRTQGGLGDLASSCVLEDGQDKAACG